MASKIQVELEILNGMKAELARLPVSPATADLRADMVERIGAQHARLLKVVGGPSEEAFRMREEIRRRMS